MDTAAEQIPINIIDEMRKSYLDYAMSVIIGRALPDARDGLKPVHRRVLYAMNELGNTFDKPYKKSARIVGDVIGKYHPHSPEAVYDTIVRMVQDFSLRYPLIDGQGNFGCFTGDTKIKLLDGTERTFAHLAERPPEQVFHVYSVDASGRIVVREGRNARVTRRNAPLVELTLDSGATIRCTPDHRFMLRDGSYKAAQDLTDQDSLMPGYFNTAPVKPGMSDYLRVLQPANGLYYGDFASILEAGQRYNHRIVSKRWLQERADVYDITVDRYHNFLLGSGVFVHNSVDGDNPAAMRYTEIRMARLADELLADIDKETVDFAANYDGSLHEPLVLPARFPNLLVNGSSGIAVGMATNIPPHNLKEIIDATILLIEKPDATLDELIALVPGPDFPTAGFICGRGGIRSAYDTGRGVVVMRARAGIEKLGREREAIVVTEIPFQINKARLIERIAELVREKRIEGISDLRDESDREGMRIVIELKREEPAQVVLNNLYKLTPMQSSFGIILLTIVNNQPQILPLRDALQCFIDHRKDVVRRRTIFDLGKAEARAHILEGLKRALDMLDAVIALIRAAKEPAVAKQRLMTQLEFSEAQAQAILEMRLQRLTGLERDKIASEYEETLKLIARYKEILASEKELKGVIVEELKEVRERFGDERRTEIVDEAVEIKLEDLIADEDVVITVTHSGYIKRTMASLYRTQGRGGKGRIGMTTRDEDFLDHVFVASTHSYLLIFTNRGQVYWLKVYEVPDVGTAGRGKAIVNLVNMSGEEKIADILSVREFEADKFVVFATRNGVVKKTALSEYSFVRSSGLKAMLIEEGDELIGCQLTDGSYEVLLATRKGKAIRFPESEVRPMGRAAYGVNGMRLQEGDIVVAMSAFTGEGQFLTVTERGYGKRTGVDEYRKTRRGGSGVINVKVGEKNGEVVNTLHVRDESSVMLITAQGKLIQLNTEDIRQTQSRAALGVKCIDLEEGDQVASATVIAREEEAVPGEAP